MHWEAVSQPSLPAPPEQDPCVAPIRPLQPFLGFTRFRLVMLAVLYQLTFKQSCGPSYSPSKVQVVPAFSEYCTASPS